MSEWITDRRPTEEDAYHDSVWVTNCGEVLITDYLNVSQNRPWMPITPPEPYVKPKRWDIREVYDSGQWYIIERKSGEVRSYAVPTREAAERIAAIYEEVMP